jgi:hypothetical protein
MLCCCTQVEPASPPLPAGSTSVVPKQSSETAPAARFRRTAQLIQCGASLVMFALIPKCPACVAAYVLCFTGVGLSYSVAAVVRWGLVALSGAVLFYVLGAVAAARLLPRRAVDSQ